MLCPKCARELPNNSTFCTFCGTPVTKQSVTAPQPVIQQPIVQQPIIQTPCPVASTDAKTLEKYFLRQKRILTACRTLEFLLLFVTIGIGYLVFAQYRQTHSSDSLDSSNRVLVVQIDDDLKASELSDDEQIKNALKNGGMIRIKISDMDSSLKQKIERYAAIGSDRNYWVIGALLNYLASEGWELTQAPTTGLTQMYYFRKK